MLLQPGPTLGAFVFLPPRPLLLFSLTSVTLPPLLPCSSPLPSVPSVRFLGVTFDQRLTWRPNILQLRDRCRSDIRLLTVIASQRWGADYTTLRRLYTSLILSKLDYGSFLYASVAPSLLLHLDCIQYAACRIILGALRCTPVYKLEAEADLMPLASRCRQLLSLYGCRVFSIPSHPVRQILLHYFPIQDFLSTSYCLPALGRLADEFAFLHLTTSCFPTSPIYTEALTAVCGKSDCLNTPFVTQSFHYILGIL